MTSVREILSHLKYDYEYRKLSNQFNQMDSPAFRIVEVETLNRCNGKCAFCPVNATEPQRPYKKMSDELFEKIIEELEQLDYDGMLSLYSNNEPFLDDRIIDFASEARRKLPQAFINLSTNGSLLTKEKVDALHPILDACVIDNYSDEGQVNSNLVDVVSHINQKGYDDVFRFVMRDRQAVLTTRGGFAPNRRDERIQTLRHGCFYPFIQMVVRPDGKCSLCCNDALGKMTLGDLNNQTMVEIWNSEEYRRIRESLKNSGRSNIPLCKYCDSMFNAYAFEKSRRHK